MRGSPYGQPSDGGGARCVRSYEQSRPQTLLLCLAGHRELAGHGDGGLPGADPPRQTRPPGLQRRPARDPMKDDPGRLVQVGAQQLVAAAGDVAGVVRLAGLVAPRRQADVGPDAGRPGEALRRIHDADVGERALSSCTAVVGAIRAVWAARPAGYAKATTALTWAQL